MGIVRGVSYGLFGRPDQFLPQMRAFGSTLVRLYVYWGQLEPAPTQYDWSSLDAFLAQLDGADEVWLTVCSSSPWATEKSTRFLPPSPAKDNATYARFIRALVLRCGGRVQYWQCNNEPSNIGLLWDGTASAYVEQLQVFHREVKACDPAAWVVLGGCGYDVLSSPAGSPAREFFDHLLSFGADVFDLFSVHLYDHPERIPSHIEDARNMMRRHGYERPVVVGEYNGPTLFEFPDLELLLQSTVAEAFATESGNAFDAASLSTPSAESPDRRAMRTLYAQMSTLPPHLQMFMDGCTEELVQKRHRINCREIVTRNLMAMATGVSRTVCWSLGPEIPNYTDPFNLMGFLSGKLALMDFEGDRLERMLPAAKTFRLLARLFAGAAAVIRNDLDDHVVAFEIQRPGRPRLNVLYRPGDVFTAEDEPPSTIDWPWPDELIEAVDVFGRRYEVTRENGILRLCVSVTPLILTSESTRNWFEG